MELQPDDEVSVRISDEDGVAKTYEAFGCTGDGTDNGYAAYVGSSL